MLSWSADQPYPAASSWWNRLSLDECYGEPVQTGSTALVAAR